MYSDEDESAIRAHVARFYESTPQVGKTWFEANVRQLLEILSIQRKQRPELTVDEFLKGLKKK
jgi:hypothetical protein